METTTLTSDKGSEFILINEIMDIITELRKKQEVNFGLISGSYKDAKLINFNSGSFHIWIKRSEKLFEKDDCTVFKNMYNYTNDNMEEFYNDLKKDLIKYL